MKLETLIATLNHIRKENLNLSSTLVLLVIKQTGTPTSHSEIKIAGYSGAKLSVNLQKLNQTGYLEETPDRRDNRRKNIYITSAGQNYLKTLLKGE